MTQLLCHAEITLYYSSVSLTQQKVESGLDDSGCVCKIKVCSTPEIFLNKVCADAKLELNFFKQNFSFFLTQLKIFLTQCSTKIFFDSQHSTQINFSCTTLSILVFFYNTWK